MIETLSKYAMFYLISQSLIKCKRPGLLGWLARLVKHPYGWTETLTADESKALMDLAEQWKIYE